MPPLSVEVYNDKLGNIKFDTQVGTHGRVYPLNFVDLLNLIKSRNGSEIKRLEYRP